MKKSLFGILGFLILCTTSFSLINAGDIHNIDLKFCNYETNDAGQIEKRYTRDLKLNLEENTEKNICISLSNSANEPLDIMLGFVDGSITNDEMQNKACKNEGDNGNFGQYVERDKKSISIPAKQTIEKQVKVNFPEGYGGSIAGCVTYYLAKNSNKSIPGSNLTILIRKASFIDAIVNSEITLDMRTLNIDSENNFSNNSKVNIYTDITTKKLVSQIKLNNTGTINQNVIIKGTISNIFGYHKTFSETKKILARETIQVNTNIDNLPRYKGPYKITYFIEHTPEFNFESELITEDMRQTNYLTETAKIFIPDRLIISIFSAIILLIAIIFILIFVLIFKSGHKEYPINIEKKKPTKKVKKKKVIKKTSIKKPSTTKKTTAKKTSTKKTTNKKPTTVKKSTTKKKTPIKKTVKKSTKKINKK